MKPHGPTVSVAAWTALLALLAAGLLAWSPPSWAALPDARAQALLRAQAAVVGLQVLALDEARSNRSLGQARQGSGVVIGGDGLVLTIGYLVIEADRVLLQLDDGRSIPARVLGVDVATGFGLVQALAPLGLEPVPLAQTGARAGLVSAAAGPADDSAVLVVSGGEDGAVSLAQLVSQRAFSGYWEYHLDQALFTTPARRDHSGAGLFNADGELLGIGSLLVADVLGAEAAMADEGTGTVRRSGNLFVPVALLPPILAELRSAGTTRASQRAWLGIHCVETASGLRVLRVNDDSPADVAGLLPGDRILGIDGQPVQALGSLWKALWAGGAPEREVLLQIQRDDAPQTLKVYSVDRMKTLQRASGI